MKKLILCLALAIGLTTHSQPAPAIVSAFSGGSAMLALVGLGALGGSYLTYREFKLCESVECEDRTLHWAFTWFTAGIILLDGEQGRAPGFEYTDLDKLVEAGLLESEANAVNAWTTELNLMLSTIASELPKGATEQDAAEMWQQKKGLLPELAFTGASKLVRYNLDQAPKGR